MIQESGASLALLKKAHSLYGLSLATLGNRLNISLPARLTGHKGLVGQMLEKALGATAGSKAIPDFPDLGIELKTIPVNARGVPSESTYVCKVPLVPQVPSFVNSVLHHKLKHVLFVPIESDKSIPLSARRIGRAFYWHMDDGWFDASHFTRASARNYWPLGAMDTNSSQSQG